MIAASAVVLTFLLLLWLASTFVAGQSGWVAWVKTTSLIAAVRLGVLWLLLLLHWREALGLWAVPLIMVLLPEGFLLPRNQIWTAGATLIASVLVTLGSTVWAIVVLATLSLFRRRVSLTRTSRG